MEIRVQVNDGETFRFQQEDPAIAEEILKSVHPARFFATPQIIIQGHGETGGFSSPFVECIEFITDAEAPWLQAQANERFTTISKEEFEKRRTELENPPETAAGAQPGREFQGIAEFVLRSGTRAYFEYSVFARDRLEQRMLLQNFLIHPSFHAYRQGGGHVLINPHNVSRWVMLPGPPELPKAAWHADRLEGPPSGDETRQEEVRNQAAEARPGSVGAAGRPEPV